MLAGPSATLPLAGTKRRLAAITANGYPLAVWALFLLAFGLRFYHYDHLSMWIDEGSTIYFARLPWRVVSGLEGWYDPHPPLYFTSLKALALIFPIVPLGRLVSVITGALTIPLVCGLGARLINRRAALWAALLTAVAPLHVWYSQETRMYTLSVLLTGYSYLALIAYHQEIARHRARWFWATVYGLTVMVSMYIVYSSAYTLVPQIFILIFLLRRHGARTRPLLVAIVLAGVGYFPWALQLFRNLITMGNERASYLDATPTAVANSLLALTGLGGDLNNFGYYAGHQPTPGTLWPFWPGLLILTLVPAVAAGIAVLIRRPLLTPLVVGAIFPGTIIAAILLSQVSPGYKDRTVLAALLGWVLLVGAAMSGDGSRRLRLLGSVGYALIMASSLIALVMMYRGGDKQHYRDLAAAVAVAARSGDPVLVASPYTGTLIGAYEPGVRLYPTVERDGLWVRLPLPQRVIDGTRVWVAYGAYAGADDTEVRRQLAALGYTRVTHTYFPHPLYLDSYVRGGATSPAIADP